MRQSGQQSPGMGARAVYGVCEKGTERRCEQDDHRGQNKLGKALMETRAAILNDPSY